MIDALISGRIFGQSQERTGKSGKPFTTCKVRTATRDDAVFVSVIAFAAPVQATLLALDDGDTVALAGELTLDAYLDRQGEPRPSANLVAHQALTAYHVQRKRRATEPPASERSKDEAWRAGAPTDWESTNSTA